MLTDPMFATMLPIFGLIVVGGTVTLLVGRHVRKKNDPLAQAKFNYFWLGVMAMVIFMKVGMWAFDPLFKPLG